MALGKRLAAVEWPRLIIALVIGGVLAVVLSVQALSSALTRSSPATAVSLFGWNGLAAEQNAFQIFQADAAEGTDLLEAATKAAVLARGAAAHDPLTPKSYSVIAMAATDPAAKSAILTAANKLNRRDLSLQALVLEQRLAAEDYSGSIATLDQILRVHPEREQEFFPVLRQALTAPGAAPLFVEILNGPAAWHENFLKFAMREPASRLAMASIREELNYEDPEVDRRLIAGLAVQDEVVLSKAIYDFVKAKPSESEEGSENSGTGDGIGGNWDNQFPPFDWRLSDESRFRSQPDRKGENLEIFARSGEGGAIAELIELAPDGPFTITATYESQSPSRSDNTRIQLFCAANAPPFVDEPLAQGANTISVDAVPDGCVQMLLRVNVRAWRGEPTVRATLGPIKIQAQ